MPAIAAAMFTAAASRCRSRLIPPSRHYSRYAAGYDGKRGGYGIVEHYASATQLYTLLPERCRSAITPYKATIRYASHAAAITPRYRDDAGFQLSPMSSLRLPAIAERDTRPLRYFASAATCRDTPLPLLLDYCQYYVDDTPYGVIVAYRLRAVAAERR